MKRTEVLQVLVTEETAATVRNLARLHDVPVSRFLNRLIRGYIRSQFDLRTSAWEASDLLGNSTLQRLSHGRSYKAGTQ